MNRFPSPNGKSIHLKLSSQLEQSSPSWNKTSHAPKAPFPRFDRLTVFPGEIQWMLMQINTACIFGWSKSRPSWIPLLAKSSSSIIQAASSPALRDRVCRRWTRDWYYDDRCASPVKVGNHPPLQLQLYNFSRGILSRMGKWPERVVVSSMVVIEVEEAKCCVSWKFI